MKEGRICISISYKVAPWCHLSSFWILPTKRLPYTSQWLLNQIHRHCRRVWKYQRYTSFVLRLQGRKQTLQICNSFCLGWLVRRMILIHSCPYPMVTFWVMCFECNNQITQTFSVGKLPEHHCKELIPTGQVLDVLVSVIFCNDTVKLTYIEECD